MKIKQLLIGALVAGVILFFWSGLTQALPWGVPSANVLISAAGKAEVFDAPTVRRFAANEFTTAKFDAEMVEKVNTLTTDATFSWIITKPLAYYSPTNYLIREFFTQLLVGLLLAASLSLTQSLPMRQRISMVGLMGLLAAVAIYGQLFNWWGLTIVYAVGASINLLLGWLIAGWVLSQFILESERTLA